MDDSSGHERRPGGTVEPEHRAAIGSQTSRAPAATAAERYELRDPFAEVTYRTATLDEMIVKADQLGATRFTAVAADGRRTTIFKAEGRWTRPDTPRFQDAPTPKEPQHPLATPLTRIARQVPIEPATPRPDPDGEREARVARLEAALNERYVIKRAAMKIGDVTIGQTEYRYRGDLTRVAFTESAFRLSTDTNSPSVARSMLDVAEARNWKALRVSGHDDFKRMVWIEASLRDVKTLGYEPVAGDQELLAKEREARRTHRIAPAPEPKGDGSTPATKSSSRGSSSRKTVLVALEAVLIAQRVPARQREAVMAAAEENLAARLRNGETHRVKVYDSTAPSQRPVIAPTREFQRTRERPAPSR